MGPEEMRGWRKGSADVAEQNHEAWCGQVCAAETDTSVRFVRCALTSELADRKSVV